MPELNTQIALQGFNYVAIEPETYATMQGYIVLDANQQNQNQPYYIERVVYKEKKLQVVDVSPDVTKIFKYNPFEIYIGSATLEKPDEIDPSDELIKFCEEWSAAKKISCAHLFT